MELLIADSASPENIGLKMKKKDNVIFVDFWDAFSNKIEKKVLSSCHKLNLLAKPLNKNKDARNIMAYHLANLLLSNFVIKRQKEDVVFIVSQKTIQELELVEHFEEEHLYAVCIKILKKFEKYLSFTVIEYEGSFADFAKLISGDKMFYKKIVGKIINSIRKQNSKNFSMKDIHSVLTEYNLSNTALKRNYTMKFD